MLGVHVVSRGASDIVGSLAPALKLGVTVDDLAFVHHVYPSYSEGLKAAAEKALNADERSEVLTTTRRKCGALSRK